MQHYPLVAIGGIGADQFSEVLETGVGSIAVVRALVATNLATDQPEIQAQRLMKLMVQC
jgi:thiamine-phosphate pyrophosphorylase